MNVRFDGGEGCAVRIVWLESDATHTNALEVKSGTHRLVWDAGKDNILKY